MRSLLLLVALTATARADVILWMTTVKDVTVQDLGSDGKPTGKARSAPMTVNGTGGCAFKVEPKGTFHPWEDGEIDDAGKFHRARNNGGAPKEVLACAIQVFLNNPIKATPGNYRVSGTVTFKKTKIQ